MTDWILMDVIVMEGAGYILSDANHKSPVENSSILCSVFVCCCKFQYDCTLATFVSVSV